LGPVQVDLLDLAGRDPELGQAPVRHVAGRVVLARRHLLLQDDRDRSVRQVLDPLEPQALVQGPRVQGEVDVVGVGQSTIGLRARNHFVTGHTPIIRRRPPDFQKSAISEVH
jgi:hypothetical protein